MYHLNNYLKKSVIILVLTMFLTIPNMRMYSFVGNYETSSPAIKANNIYDLHTNKEIRPNFPIAQAGIMIGVLFLSMAVATAVAISLAVGDRRGVIMDPTLESNHFNHYEKYDFSQFDN